MTSTLEPPTATVYISELVRALKVAGHYAAEEGINGSLRYVCVETGGGVFTATSTNRYVAAHARGEAAGQLPKLWIRRDYAASIAEFLEVFTFDRSQHALVMNSQAFRKVRLTMTGQRVLSVLLEDGTTEVFKTSVKIEGDWTGREEWPFDNPEMVESTFRTVTDYADAHLHGLSKINLAHIAPLLELLAGDDFVSGYCALRFSFTGQTTPVRVEHGDWLLLAVMPIHPRPDHGKTLEPVPYGLPRQPVE